MNKTIAGLAGVAALTASAALACPAGAASPAETWVMNSATVHGADKPIRIVASGPVSGAGLLTQEFEETENGDVVHAVWHFAKGTVSADAYEDFALAFDPVACRGVATSSGTWVITGGTGAYAGATGHGTFGGTGTIIGQRDQAGACQGPESDVDPTVSVASLRGSGTAELG